MTYMSKEEIVKDCVARLEVEDVEMLLTIPESEMGKYHHSYGMYVRNHYGLWHSDNPLTKVWFDACDNKDVTYILNGVDCHPNHPDNLSGEILKMIWREVNQPVDLVSLIDIRPRPKDKE
jgi:uncharacterized protein DUF6794